MSNFFISVIGSIGISAWLYNMVQRYNGGQTKQSLTVAGISAILLFLIILTILNIFFKS